ncbi:hypothetical protein [Hippea alviniae]|uniref:hypothetical protein n=1 Tax=Hippea alviniae TaxID=1279027 RepID=UPI0003B4B88B|nr:hypothetical protein [Hippea alviniae]
MFSKEIQNEIEKLSIQTNKTQEEVLRESINLYKEFLKLKEEFDLWDEITDTDFANFEKELENGDIPY